MYAQIRSGQPIELTGGTITSGDVQFSYETALAWSDAERASKDILPIVDDAIPAGKVAAGSTLEKIGNTVARRFTLADAPPPPDPLSSWDVITLKVAFNHENRIRALEGKAAVTAAQFKNAVKALAGV